MQDDINMNLKNIYHLVNTTLVVARGGNKAVVKLLPVWEDIDMNLNGHTLMAKYCYQWLSYTIPVFYTV